MILFGVKDRMNDEEMSTATKYSFVLDWGNAFIIQALLLYLPYHWYEMWNIGRIKSLICFAISMIKEVRSKTEAEYPIMAIKPKYTPFSKCTFVYRMDYSDQNRLPIAPHPLPRPAFGLCRAGLIQDVDIANVEWLQCFSSIASPS